MTDIQRNSGPLGTPAAAEDLPPRDDSAADVLGGKGGSCDRDDDRGGAGRGHKGGKGPEKVARGGVQQSAGSTALAQANQSSQTALGLLK